MMSKRVVCNPIQIIGLNVYKVGTIYLFLGKIFLLMYMAIWVILVYSMAQHQHDHFFFGFKSQKPPDLKNEYEIWCKEFPKIFPERNLTRKTIESLLAPPIN